jgi:hypothetical protein
MADHTGDPRIVAYAQRLVTLSSRYAFLPFGGGPRVCIGAGFAMIEAAIILATVVRAFCFQPVAGHKPKPVAKITLRPNGGMPLLIHEPVKTSGGSRSRRTSSHRGQQQRLAEHNEQCLTRRM